MTQKNNHKLRVGIVGAGGHRAHAAFAGAEKESRRRDRGGLEFQLRKRGEILPGELPQATPMRNWADLLAVPDLDIIWIGTPPYMHSAVTISALEAGKHVFCQARMSMDLAEAKKCSRRRNVIRNW